MKLPARRSLLHGHRGVGAHGERASDVARTAARTRRSRRAAGNPVAHVREVAGCRSNMSKSLTNRGPSCSCRMPAATRASAPARAKVVVVRSCPSRNPMTSTPRSGPVVDDRGADAGLGGGPGVRVLRVPVDAEQAGVAAAPADDEVPLGVVTRGSGWSARRAARPRCAGGPQDRDPVQQGLELGVRRRHRISRRTPRARPCRSCSLDR